MRCCRQFGRDSSERHAGRYPAEESLRAQSHEPFYFVPSDRKDRDIAIASRILPTLGPVADATSTTKAFNHPLAHEGRGGK